MKIAASSIESRAKFDFIRYANLWEDADVLCQALEPRSGKRILSIASGGDNAFALAAEGADVIAADLNPAQLAIVELKIAAFKNLEHGEVLEFVGIKDSGRRVSIFEELKAQLSDSVRDYWESHLADIYGGIIHCGKFERYFQTFRRYLLPLIHKRSTLQELFEAKSFAERVGFHDKQWNSFRWRLLFKIFFSQRVMGKLGRDPEFFRFVEGKVSDRFLERTTYALTELDPHLNPYLQYILLGNYFTALPRCYRKEEFFKVRKGLARIQLCHGAIQDVADATVEGGFDGYNLSDIFEYLSEEMSRDVYMALLNHANSSARFAYWNMLVPRKHPIQAQGCVQRIDSLSKELFLKDLAFFYSDFVVEEKV